MSTTDDDANVNLSKTVVHYRPARTPSRSCGECVMGEFALNATVGRCVNKNGTTHVRGQIHANDTCDDFYPREGK